MMPLKKYSNINAEKLKEAVKSLLPQGKDVVKDPPYKKKETVCLYAEDTGEKAFLNMPCRGNRIICQCPENKGFVSYTKACNPGMCKFFRQKEGENLTAD